MSNLNDQLQEEVQKHNELHQQIQAGEEQLAQLREERSRRVGRITLLQELAQVDDTVEPTPADE